MSLYFAYGSNLDAPDRDAWMAAHAHPGARFDAAGPALLLDRRLSFERFSRGRGGGALTLSAAPGHAVEGVLFEINEAALEALDAKEGHPHAYAREEVHAILPDGRVRAALTYDVPPDRRVRHAAPTSAYLALVRRALAAHGLTTAALDAAALATVPPLVAPRLFVYGTLRAGQPNAALLDGLPREPATCPGRLHDRGAWPLMTLGHGTVHGELVPLDPARLAALDALEDARPFGAPGGRYRRTVLPATLGDGTTARAQLYVVEDAGGHPEIESGDWLSVGDRRAAWAAHRAG
jgi:gamma-glutamylcyclotransferase (GGCT)/AIG2-like uncharacterized protein YtfP